MSELIKIYALLDSDLSEEDIASEKKSFEEFVVKNYKLKAQSYIRNILSKPCSRRLDDYNGNSRNHYINKVKIIADKIFAICEFCGDFNPEHIGKSPEDWISLFLENEGFKFDDATFDKEEKSNV